MKLRTEAVLRYHKFNKLKNLHEHLYSELQLYYPHTNNTDHGELYCLIEEKVDFEICKATFDISNIQNVKKIIMPFIESVQEGMETAHTMKSTIGEELDPQNEQDRLECEAIGLENNPDWFVCPLGLMIENVEGYSFRNVCIKYFGTL